MPLVYFDSSALVKLVIEEPGSELAASLWDGADAVITSGLAYPEVRAALAAANRDGRLSGADLRTSKRDWGGYWRAMRIVMAEIDLLVRAGDLAEKHGLRGYDAVHLASALAIGDSTVIVASWDERLRAGVLAAKIRAAPAEI